ncbi:hypothetical protein ACET3Z_025520 [Daucus carota]
MISTEDIPTYLKDNGGIIDLDDGEGSPEEEMEFDSDSEELGSSQSDDPNRATSLSQVGYSQFWILSGRGHIYNIDGLVQMEDQHPGGDSG